MKKLISSALICMVSVTSMSLSSVAFAEEDTPIADYSQISTKDLQRRSNDGDDRATFQIANRTLKGLGQPAEPEVAFKLFKSLADKGVLEAQLNVGRMYVMGNGTKEDLKAASRYLETPAKQGNSKAVFLLAYVQERSNASLAMAYSLYKRVTMDYGVANRVREVAQQKVATLANHLSSREIDGAEVRLQQWLSPLK